MRRHESPFKSADQFVAHALLLVPRVFMLLRLAFLESARRTPILESPACRCSCFSQSAPDDASARLERTASDQSTAYAWFVFEQKHNGPATIDRISAGTEGAPRC